MGEPEILPSWKQLDPVDLQPVVVGVGDSLPLGIASGREASALENRVSQLSPAALAYLGDAVYELYVRTKFLLPPKRSSAYHQQVVAQVRAEAQSAHLQLLLSHLTATELDIARRGRNATNTRPRRLAPDIYQQATSFETLVGYLYLTDSQRLWELLSLLQFAPEDRIP